MTEAEDWTPSEDAQLRYLFVAGWGWDNIADALLREVREVQARAVELERAGHAAKGADVDTWVDEEETVKNPKKKDYGDDITIVVNPEQDQPAMGVPDQIALIAARDWSPLQGPPEPPVERRCAYCGAPLQVQIKGRPRVYCNDAHRNAARNLRLTRAEAPRQAAAVAPFSEDPWPVKGRCRFLASDGHGCILRARHKSEHLTETGIIASRMKDKQEWRDRNDAYLRMALVTDEVAPNPGAAPAEPR